MSPVELILVLSSLAGIVAAIFFYFKAQKPTQIKEIERIVEKEVAAKPSIDIIETENKARELLIEAKSEALEVKAEAEEDAHRIRLELVDLEKRLANKEDVLERHQQGIEKREKGIAFFENRLKEKEKQLDQVISQELGKLEQVAGLSREEAKKEVFTKLERELGQESSRRIKEAEDFIREESDKKAREILLTVLQRVATEHAASSTTDKVQITDDEIKGRIIGKEGRNIKAFENAAGVEVEIGDEAGVVLVSSFDPIKREVARLSLEKLIADGRIQPARIEEIVAQTQGEVDSIIHQTGEDLAYKVGVANLPREIVNLLGRFKYRSSYGQNMLEHTLEVIRIGELLAAELGADVELVKKACLLHDLGKAVTAEMADRSHDEVGAEIARRFGIDELVVRTFEGHHKNDFPNLEAVIVYLADAISGSRPGARREDYEAFIQRVKELENIALSFSGVDKAYAISAGREVRVIVRPFDIDDSQMVKLAHDIVRKIHEQVANFPGQIKVTVIRETRATDVVRGT